MTSYRTRSSNRRPLRAAIAVCAGTLLAALLPFVGAPAASAAPSVSPGCAAINAGWEFNEPTTTGLGLWNTYFAGDSLSIIITRNEWTKGFPTWLFEIDGVRIARTTLVGTNIRFAFTFTEDTYSNVYLATTGSSAAEMKGTCTPTTDDRLRIATWPHLPGGPEGEAYEAAVEASGGRGPYSWAVTEGQLPPGVSMSSSGAFTGTPSEPGSFTFTVIATDADGATVSRELQIDIWPAEDDEEWASICHRTDTGYEYDVVPTSSLEGDGEHADHAGDIVADLAETGIGRNWDAAGEEVFWNDCTATLAEQSDVDEDGLIGLVDTDDDGDGVSDAVDPDADGDGVPDDLKSSSFDADADGVPDVADPDDDGDGLMDVADPDDDGDGNPDTADPDALMAPDQDGDGLPDALDPDDDGDCLADAVDRDRDGDGLPNSADPDLDNDGIPDVVDIDRDGDGIPNLVDRDVNGDGVPSMRANDSKAGCVANQDADGDGIPNVKDPDDDGDGIPDASDHASTRPWIDTDLDGIPNIADDDLDGDRIPNAIDKDLDGDGVPNLRDVDDDGDGLVDARGTTSSGKAVRPVRASTTVTFAAMSDVLSAAAKAQLKALVKKAGRSPSTVVSNGYVQASKTSSNDRQLSNTRARAAASYLASLGVKSVYSVRGEGIGGVGPSARKVVVTIMTRR